MSERAVAERLNRFLARRGVASRRGADTLIERGRVTLNGRVATLGATVDAENDRVAVDGREIDPDRQTVTILLNKPPGVVTTRRDTHGRATVMELVEVIPGLVPVGRLDTDSRGLLLLTTDGDLAHRLTHPRFGVPKVYQISAVLDPTAAVLERLRAGVELDDGPAKPLAVSAGVHARGAVIEITMGEGRKREVRRLCAAVGIDVVDLCRVAIGPVRLGSLGEGRSRRLHPDELAALRLAVGLDGAPA